jgi:hypothetical protein
MRRRALLLGLAALPLAGCGINAESVWAPDDVVARARYRDSSPPHLALVTVRNEEGGSGAHSALLVSGSERVLFDPFGGWKDPLVPERNDVLHGFSPEAEARYLNYQAQDGYFYVRQEVQVSPEVAEQALELVKGYGPVGMAMCTNAIADVLRRLPGFEGVGSPWDPDGLSRRFARLPGVTTTERHGPPRT